MVLGLLLALIIANSHSSTAVPLFGVSVIMMFAFPWVCRRRMALCDKKEVTRRGRHQLQG